jgi:hypothetical protein
MTTPCPSSSITQLASISHGVCCAGVVDLHGSDTKCWGLQSCSPSLFFYLSTLSQPLLFLTTHAHSAKEEEHEALPKTLSLGEDKDYIVSAAVTAYLFITQIYNIYTRGCAH